MTDSTFDVIAAFVDGEHVSPEALKIALADAEARDSFIDLLSLREATRQLDEIAAPARTASTRWRTVARVAAAAALVIGASTAGYFTGHRTAAASAPEPAVMSETVIDMSTPVPMLAPTRVIKLQSGVNWTDQNGGK